MKTKKAKKALPIKAKKARSKSVPAYSKSQVSSLTATMPYLIVITFIALFLAVVAYAMAIKSQWSASQFASFGSSGAKTTDVVKVAPTPQLPKK